MTAHHPSRQALPDASTTPHESPAGAEAATLLGYALAAAELADAIGNQAERDAESFAAGFRYAARTFFDHGVDVGRAQAHHAIDQQWAHLAAQLAATAHTPSHAEMDRRRYPHHTPERLAELRRQARRQFGLLPPEPNRPTTTRTLHERNNAA